MTNSAGVTAVQKADQTPVSHERAREAAQRLINSHFGNRHENARTCIPAHPDDDDLVITRYIDQQAALPAPSAPPPHSQASEVVEALAKKLSNALLKVRPLGGSELFVRVGDDFYADAEYCGRLIDEMRAELHELRKHAALSRQVPQPADMPSAFAAEETDEILGALAQLRNVGAADSEIAVTARRASELIRTLLPAADMPSGEWLRALKFYADPKRYCGANIRVDVPDEYQPVNQPYLLDVTRDGGRIARDALSAAPSAQGKA